MVCEPLIGRTAAKPRASVQVKPGHVVPIWKLLATAFRPQWDIHIRPYPAAVLHRRLTAPQARREIEHYFGGAQCSIIGPISLIRTGIFRMRYIWNAPTTNKQRNAPRNSYLTAMPSFGRRIGLLRSTPRERAHYRRLVISSVSEPPRPRAEDCVEGLNGLIFSEWFMGCVGGCEVAEGCAALSFA